MTRTTYLAECCAYGYDFYDLLIDFINNEKAETMVCITDELFSSRSLMNDMENILHEIGEKYSKYNPTRTYLMSGKKIIVMEFDGAVYKLPGFLYQYLYLCKPYSRKNTRANKMKFRLRPKNR